jgi:hypothetical protein
MKLNLWGFIGFLAVISQTAMAEPGTPLTLKPARVVKTDVQVMKLILSKKSDGTVSGKTEIVCQFSKPTGVYEYPAESMDTQHGVVLEPVEDTHQCTTQLNGLAVQIKTDSSIQLMNAAIINASVEKLKIFQGSFLVESEDSTVKSPHYGFASASTSDLQLSNLTLFLDDHDSPSSENLIPGQTREWILVVARLQDSRPE